ncbi:ABC-F family ATP-binding cassette domain-containing protein [Parafilimonas terrae]|uniref:ATPase components of ABC transporters with duplicated ATPase domains n=1 Tax=Parafilimonas terrae TaxID=1465490 RepID=A0A1I5UCL6_9BACT|nr:ABC-F family ATP-binding cassette domain-containing protein [Parafilimonas terrae]SFP92952.1 ATPase components of ABC transporters with duplicated ATPase domains [Parafilimonas terrae]
MLILNSLSYIHPDKYLLFDNISLNIATGNKVALLGNNGVGKSTLLKIIAGLLPPSQGFIQTDTKPYYVPQVFGQYDHVTIAQALQAAGKLNALQQILNGDTSDVNYSILNDDWTIEERCHEALQYWQIDDIDLQQIMSTLSGGQKMRVLLAGIYVNNPEFILLDEPSNHLDTAGRILLYDFIESSASTLLIISHDRKLLNKLDTVCELTPDGINVYGGNYNFYAEQKKMELQALNEDVRDKEKSLRKAREKERETIERQQKLNARGKRKQEKAGLPTIVMNSFRNNAEKSTSKLKGVHAAKTASIENELQELRKALPDIDTMRFGFDDTLLHKGKILFRAENINFSYNENPLWQHDLNFEIISGERIALKGKNGSGKTTLIKITLGRIKAGKGSVYSAINNAVYIDQDYSLINNNLSVYEQAEQFNNGALQEHEIKNRLNRFLFTKTSWNKSCAGLSGGERMRLMLCCLTIANQAPDMIILDEPTNNLDIQNIEILTTAINQYNGTLIIVSHDAIFLEEVGITRNIELI